jgi:Holliday junction DNA helicase RuvA
MFSHLRGTVSKRTPGQLSVDVGGVGYRVLTPMTTWDDVSEDSEVLLHVSPYVREDRFDLFGFNDARSRDLFEALLNLQGVGPKLGLELCDVPRTLLAQAVHDEDATLLTSIKGIGKKTAEKLLLELKSLAERDPDALSGVSGTSAELGARYDQDAAAALTQLGYRREDVLTVLAQLPADLRTTADRVTAALRSL